MPVLRLFLLLVCLAFSREVFSQANQYQFSRLDIRNGLSHNQVNTIYKDKQGFMWFGTMSGLNRYDGFKFKSYRYDLQDSASISDDDVQNIFEGPDHKLWVQTRNNFNTYDPVTEKFSRSIQSFMTSVGLPSKEITTVVTNKSGVYFFVHAALGIYSYDTVKHRTVHFYHSPGIKTSLHSNLVASVYPHAGGDLWIVYKDGIIERLDTKRNRIVFRSEVLYNASKGILKNYKLYADSDGDLWLYSNGDVMGVYYFSPSRNVFKHFTKDQGSARLNSNSIYTLLQDNKGLIWIASDHGGINLLDKRNFHVTYLKSREDDDKSISQNSVTTLYKDNTGIIWAGTYKKGISYYHENIIRFPLYRHHASDPTSLSFDDVNKFVEDAKGNLWIGTNGGGLLYFDRKSGKFSRFTHQQGNSNSLSSDVIVSLHLDSDQKLWIGTYLGGLDRFDGRNFTHFRHDSSNPASISDDRIWEIMEDSSHRLWIGTMTGGLNLYDRSKNTFSHYLPNHPNSIHCAYISALMEDKDRNIWIAGYAGIDVLVKKTGKFIRYTHDDKNPNSLIHNNVSTIKQDSRGLIWIGTREGLNIFNPRTARFSLLRKENGLPENTILEILEDNQKNMWLSTTNGLSNILVSKGKGDFAYQVKNFDETDGLQGREFNENAALKTRNGELIFGGANGFNLFNPADIHVNKADSKLVLTDFLVFNQSVVPGQEVNGRVILDRSIQQTKSILLHHDENIFAIEFAALNFFNSDKVKHQYMMEGFNKAWVNSDNGSRKATYTNLDQGDYVFKVRAISTELGETMAELAIPVRILPPIWQTTFAYVIYALVFFGVLFYIRYRGIRKLKAQFDIDLERKEAHRLHELDLMKIKFLTNVSHEFRTPLSLIIAPVDKILNETENPDQKNQLNMIKRNTRRLLNLVNQLLDFRKMEVEELKLHPQKGDIINFIREVSHSFTDIAGSKNIGFVFDSDTSSLETVFDHDKIERILFNLLSNAFKFTHQGGHISVLLSHNFKESSVNEYLLDIKVIDTGIGIPEEKHDRIFDRFFQNDLPGSILNQGSGIGLSIVKEFVKMHGGTIRVESEPNQGSCFIIELYLPVLDSADSIETSEDLAIMEKSLPKRKDLLAGKKPTVLLVEDNDDFRFYLKDNLKDSFHIIEAANGKEGWQKALALHPDLMVSDINMPEMTGTELCHKIKADSRTSHIPVILLTAITAEEEQMKGLENGANDYMTKPFNFEILLSKIKNLLTLQSTFKKTYSKQVDIQLADIEVQSMDEKFMNNMMDYLEKNIMNPDLSVEELSRQMAMSRVSLYKKVLQLSGKTPVEFIRSFRLKKAAQLLEKSQMNVNEVSYEVGFNTPKYFAKSFKIEFNMLPSEYIASFRKRASIAETTLE